MLLLDVYVVLLLLSIPSLFEHQQQPLCYLCKYVFVSCSVTEIKKSEKQGLKLRTVEFEL
jgi:hypothetical protein